MAIAKSYINVESRLIQSNEFAINSVKNLIAIGFGDVGINRVLKSWESIKFGHSNVENFIIDQLELGFKPEIDAILCHYSISANDIKDLKRFMSSSVEFSSVPIVLFKNPATANFSHLVYKLGIDDVFDESTELDLFYERIDLIKKTKIRQLENRGDQLTLSLANIDVNINIFKRIGDIFIASFMLIALFPLFIIVAILVKLESKGPVFYTAKRAGCGYKIFDFYKFRTMSRGADKEMTKVMHLNQYDEEDDKDSTSVFYKIKGDPRVTKIGAFLRKTSIDELPQLVNVLIGDMSLVGNRPLPLYEAQQLTRDNWVARFNAPAGITGLWQISKRGKAEMSEEERVELDVEYSRHNSFWYDLLILIKTVPVIFQEDDV